VPDIFNILYLSPRNSKRGSVKAEIIEDLSEMLARGEHRKVKKKVKQLLSSKSSRNQLFEAKDSHGQSILHLAVEAAPGASTFEIF
jgi:hypothetical protein